MVPPKANSYKSIAVHFVTLVTGLATFIGALVTFSNLFDWGSTFAFLGDRHITGEVIKEILTVAIALAAGLASGLTVRKKSSETSEKGK
jgi:hypothetical protein